MAPGSLPKATSWQEYSGNQLTWYASFRSTEEEKKQNPLFPWGMTQHIMIFFP